MLLLVGISTPALGVCCGGGACARLATGAKLKAATTATAAAIRDRRNTLPAPTRAPARSVTSEAAKPTHLRRQRAKRQPPGRRVAAEG
jgi:hypothetical protein